jgi:hypothetical protein
VNQTSLYSLKKIRKYLRQADAAPTRTEKGAILEDLVCYLIEKIPGVSVLERNETTAFNDEEFDILAFNEQDDKGVYFLPCTFLIECKNWATPVGSRTIVNFKSTLRSRGCDHGILVATHGISGTNDPPTEAYHEIALALSDMFHILVITRQEIEGLNNSDSLVDLLKQRLCGLKRRGTAVL